jgi:hypothetical protein
MEDFINLQLQFEHFDDTFDNNLFEMVHEIKRLAKTVRVYVLCPKSAYVYPDYLIDIVCIKNVICTIRESISRYCSERFRQKGMKIIMKECEHGMTLYPCRDSGDCRY